MENKTIIALFVGAMLTSTACDNGGAGSTDGKATTAAKAQNKDVGEVLATVNGLKVGASDYKAAAARKVPANGKTLSTEEKTEVLDRLVDEKLLYLAALDQGLDQDPKVQKVMVNTLLREAVYAKVKNSDFTDEDLQKYFDEHKDEFIVPEKVQIKRILVKVSDERPDDAAKSEAERILGELKGDVAQFKQLASKHSEDPYKRRGGDVGFVPKDGKPGLDSAVVEKAFSLGVGDLSDVFKTDEGYNIVLNANKRDKVERTFQQMKGSVLRKIKNEKLKSLYDSYVADLRTGAKVAKEDAKLAEIEVEPARAPKHPGITPTGGRSIPRSKVPPGILAPTKAK